MSIQFRKSIFSGYYIFTYYNRIGYYFLIYILIQFSHIIIFIKQVYGSNNVDCFREFEKYRAQDQYNILNTLKWWLDSFKLGRGKRESVSYRLQKYALQDTTLFYTILHAHLFSHQEQLLNVMMARSVMIWQVIAMHRIIILCSILSSRIVITHSADIIQRRRRQSFTFICIIYTFFHINQCYIIIVHLVFQN